MNIKCNYLIISGNKLCHLSFWNIQDFFNVHLYKKYSGIMRKLLFAAMYIFALLVGAYPLL